MPIEGPLLSASKVQNWLLPTDREMVAALETSAHAKTASSGYSLLRMVLEAPPEQMVALGWMRCQKTTWSSVMAGGLPFFHHEM